MFVFQFFHWFKPSEPFFADYVLPHYGISMQRLVSDVYAWDTLFQIASAALLLGVFVAFGAYTSLLLCAVATVCTVLCVLPWSVPSLSHASAGQSEGYN